MTPYVSMDERAEKEKEIKKTIDPMNKIYGKFILLRRSITTIGLHLHIVCMEQRAFDENRNAIIMLFIQID